MLGQKPWVVGTALMKIELSLFGYRYRPAIQTVGREYGHSIRCKKTGGPAIFLQIVMVRSLMRRTKIHLKRLKHYWNVQSK
jgi:hypothetical protein